MCKANANSCHLRQLLAVIFLLPDRLCAFNRYDRELMKTTVRAMERVQKVKEAREKRFWDKRMEGNKELTKERELAEVRQGLDLIVSPLAQEEMQKVTQKAATRSKQKA
eukprot:3713269-Pleurochrysis_carterae.AAC.1